MRNIKKGSAGDTIIEVLIAIGIAAFAIAISYATAHRSLNQAITAREHNEALNIIENQIADLKLRYLKSSTGAFNANFALPRNHFCLDDKASDPSDANWARHQNWSGTSETSPLSSALSPNAAHPYYYNASNGTGCQHQKAGEGAIYYVDIVTSNKGSASNPTLYQIFVRWERIGGGQVNQTSLFYRVTGPKAVSAVSAPIAYQNPLLSRVNHRQGAVTG